MSVSFAAAMARVRDGVNADWRGSGIPG